MLTYFAGRVFLTDGYTCALISAEANVEQAGTRVERGNSQLSKVFCGRELDNTKILLILSYIEICSFQLIIALYITISKYFPALMIN